MNPEKAAHDSPFPQTRPSLLKRGRASETQVAMPALGELFAIYRPALLARLNYWLSRWNLPQHMADDILQDFAKEKIVSRKLVASFDPKRKFRTFLLTSLDRFARSWMRKRMAVKREPESEADELDDQKLQAQPSTLPGDLEWAQEVINEALRRVKHQCELEGQANFWEVFKSRVVVPSLDGTVPPSYKALVERFGFANPMEAANALLTVTRRFRRAVETIIGNYEMAPKHVAGEIIALREILTEAAL